jgi:putative ABC transport system substrate-binding protein
VDAIAVFAGPSLVAAKAATSVTPIIFLTGYDPVSSGFVASLNRPGGNLTGVSILTTQVMAKRLQLLGELVPTAKSVGFLYNSTNLISGYERLLKDVELAADDLGVKLLRIETEGPDDFEKAFAKIAGVPCDALLVSADALIVQNREKLVSLAARHKIPAIYPIRDFAAAGGLVSYGPDYNEAYRQAGEYLGKVLSGERPANLPIQQVMKLELVINMKTAKAMGVEIPAALLVRADEVIE